MKFSVIVHNKVNKNIHPDGLPVDGYLKDTWINGLKRICTYTENHEEADFSLFFIYYPGVDYEYDDTLDKVKFNNIIVVDYIEFGDGITFKKDYKNCYSIYGFKHDLEKIQPNYWEVNKSFCAKIHEKLQSVLKPYIRLYYKREMISDLDYSKIGVDVLPCDYINYISDFKVYNRDDFYNKKTVDLLYIWGRSGIDRVKMHGRIMYEMDKWGHSMFFTEKQFQHYHLGNNSTRTMLLFGFEGFERVDWIYYQNLSQCVLDMFGSGMKCFRNVESSFGAVSIKQDPTVLVHKYPWVDGVNCVSLPIKEDNHIDIDNALEKIWDYIRGDKRDDLYNIYLNSIETGRKYDTMVYLTNYVLPEIKCRLV